MLRIPRVIWGVYTITSALLLLINGVTGFRQARRWAWYVACYQIARLAQPAAWPAAG